MALRGEGFRVRVTCKRARAGTHAQLKHPKFMIALADCNTFFASLDIPLLEPARAIASPYPEGRDLGWG